MLAAATPVLAVARSFADLAPFLAAMVVGFLVGAWGQAAKVPLAVAIGILIIVFAAAFFVLGNDAGGSGVPGTGVISP